MSECTHNCSTCSADCGSREKESLIKKPHAMSNIGKVFGVVSGKGGVGKSMITSQLAVTMNRRGYSVGIISQPDWKDENSVTIYGEPRLAFLISAGNMDSMVNHYFVSKKHRPTDAYTPGGEINKRPDRATAVYGNLIRRTYKNTPIIIG